MKDDVLAARSAALDLLGAVLTDGALLSEALEAHRGLETLARRDRAFARTLVLTTLRRLGQIDAALGSCLERPLPGRQREARDILRLGACQLLFLGTPPHAAVDSAVRLAQRRKLVPLKALINAVLRRLASDGAEMIAGHDAPRLNTPDWLWRSWCGAYGTARARAIAQIHLAEPPLDLSVKDDAEAWAARLGAERLWGGTIRLEARGPIEDLPGYAAGAWWVQDAAAALPARLLGDVEAKRVIELCAAPGGKTAQLACAGARILAVDRSGMRLERLKANMKRLDLSARIVEADATRWRFDVPVDFVLLDAPCTATGAIRRHPDIPRLRTPEDVARLASLQDALLAAAVEMLGPGGCLVYATCSLEPEECELRIAALLESGAPVLRDRIRPAEIGNLEDAITPAGDLRTFPSHLAEKGGMDGFYAARLRRTP